MTRERSCGECSLCCTVLRVDELRKLGGTPCRHQRAGGGCEIHPDRPGICRAYRCLWLQGSLETDDRPDQLGAVLDLVTRATHVELVIHLAGAEGFEASPRLREIAAHYRESMPVRISAARDVMNPDRPIRMLLPDGTEQRFEGERVTVLRPGEPVSHGRLPWIERWARRISLRVQAWRLRSGGGGA